MESAAIRAGLGDTFAIPSASCRTVVYKGLVAGARLADLYPDLRRPGIELSYAMFHQRYATNTHPTWRLAQPFRTIAAGSACCPILSNQSLRGFLARLPIDPVAGQDLDRRRAGPDLLVGVAGPGGG